MDMLEMALNIAKDIEKSVKPLIGWEKSNEVVKIGADGTPTKRIDLIAENVAINSIEKVCSAILISEEIGFKKIGKNKPEYVIVLDPVDGTYNSLKDIPFYSAAVAIGRIDKFTDNLEELINNLKMKDLEVGVVRNIATGDTYYAEKGKGAHFLRKGEKKSISISNSSNLKDSSIGLFAHDISIDTLKFIKDRRFRRIRLFGSIALEMCYVAKGALDAFINVNETTRLCDIAAGYVIIKEAGGIVTDKNGQEVNLDLDVNSKVSVICSNEMLHKKLVGIFGNRWRIKPTNFGIISRIDNEESIDVADNVIKYLDSKGIKYELDSSTYDALKNRLTKKCDIISNIEEISHMISIGGDGTVLRASKMILGNEIPMVCINMGTVGFLTEFNKEEIFSAIDSIICGNYKVEKRTKLMGFAKLSDGKQHILNDSLNEVVITTKNPAKMMHFEVYIDGSLVEDVRADGIIVSTPNGSTAYSLSSGGPIIEPTVEGFVIVPICPFKLSSRPLVVNANSEIKIKLLKKSTYVVIDGNTEFEAKKGDEIILRKSESNAYFVKGDNFYNKLKKLSLM